MQNRWFLYNKNAPASEIYPACGARFLLAYYTLISVFGRAGASFRQSSCSSPSHRPVGQKPKSVYRVYAAWFSGLQVSSTVPDGPNGFVLVYRITCDKAALPYPFRWCAASIMKCQIL